ncbi:TPA: transcriptional regulator GcvA [Vibrio vulnificus]|uniref:transcriptional regulator GcvA n=1 Tax=Vibrio vulnificus TaxID=672 RepID=UPI0005F1E44D|nr:transcriptional regulator GcvA [Vibrio vulnificus]HAS6360936.1 transcriptional regulator GcvA [Vibrio vulnificus]HDY7541343.1 transcriptional regulator GcvA [Vibrio vulnificus]HDY7682687.1 transcriptional regulator GcvA [Vibrio vulnificus]
MKLPIHLNALRAFEASARHQSFSAAAEELHVSPAAVGQLVRSLEEWLDAPLFHRMNSGKIRLIPTETAERALPDIRAGFDKLIIGLERLQESSVSGVLTVTVSPAFAAKWLLPRLDRFQDVCSETDVRLDTNLKPVDFAVQRVDIGVRYGLGNWSGLKAEKLMDEEVYPVCSPRLLREQRRFHHPCELLRETLIHDLSMDAHTGFPTWSEWLRKAGVTDQETAHNIQINNSAAVLQSAIDGRGIALARSVMVRDDLASGHLIRLFPEIQFNSPLAYYVVYRPECAELPRMQAFRGWLFSEVNRDEEQ